MEMRNLGRSGLKVSLCGLGCNNFGMRMSEQAAVDAVVGKALDAGITLFDTADVYGRGQSETMLGRALGARRKETVIATKFAGAMGDSVYDKGGSRRHVMEACEASLKRLGTDYIDLYQMHFPDAETPIEETLSALDRLVRQGKVRYIGNSNFAGWQIAQAHYLAGENGFTPFVSAQNNYSLVNREAEREVVPAAKEFGLGVLPYFPLASGVLTGKYKRGQKPPEGTRLAAWGGQMVNRFFNEKIQDQVEKLEDFARERGHSLTELAFGWLASQGHVASVIAGATRPEQVEENAKAVEWKLAADEVEAARKLSV